MESGRSERLKILVLSRNMERYSAAYYQKDFLFEISRQANCHFYGPGFSNYRLGDSIHEILKGAPFVPDFIVTAHSFLEDNPGEFLEAIPGVELESSPVPVFGILNKEYSRLAQKIDYFSKIGVTAAFTHHHKLEDWTSSIDFPHIFLPFAVNPNRFRYFEGRRMTDVGFSGVLQNPFFRDSQPDTRAQIMNEFFFSALSTPIMKKPKHRGTRVIWRSWTGNRFADFFGLALGHGKFSEDAYLRALASTKVWINSPSPLGLISTRYFECMASGTFVVAQESPGLDSIFPRELMATYRDSSDFFSTLELILEDKERIRSVTKKARDFVLGQHTWSIRIGTMLETMARHTGLNL